MSVKPKLQTVWQPTWGPAPSMEALAQRPDNTDQPPGLWPKVDGSAGFRTLAIQSKDQWLALVKLDQPDALSREQVDALLGLGFRQGSEGRLIYPGYPSLVIADTLSRILGEPLEPITSEQVAILTPGNTFEPVVPLEVQAGIRWYWKQRPQELLAEIVATLSEKTDELSEDYLALLEGVEQNEDGQSYPITDHWLNPLRLKMWVNEALQGELTPVTEAIMGLGLHKGIQQFGPESMDWPEDVQAFARILAEYRGEPEPEEQPLADHVGRTLDVERPALKTRITWETEGQTLKGIVVGVPTNDLDSVWVTPLEPAENTNASLPFYVPPRIRVSIADIVSPRLSRPSAPASVFDQVDDAIEAPSDSLDSLFESNQEESAESESAGAPEQDENDYTPQPEVKLADLSGSLRELTYTGILPSRIQDAIRYKILSGTLSGQHPLAMTMDTTATAKDMVANWSHLENTFYEFHDMQAAREDANVLARDLLVAQYNEAQPKTPGGRQWPLAVLPMGHLLNIEITNEKLHTKAEALNVYRVGFSPLMLSDLRDEMFDWSAREMPRLTKAYGQEISRDLEAAHRRLFSRSLQLNQCTFGLPDNSLKRVVSNLYKEARRDVDEKQGEGITEYERVLATLDRLAEPDMRQRLVTAGEGTLFTSSEDAGKAILTNTRRTNQVAARNAKIIQALADLSGKTVSSVVELPHPWFVMARTLAKGDLPNFDMHRIMAMLNMDLAEHSDQVGLMARLCDLEIETGHNTLVREKPSKEDADKLESLGVSTYVMADGMPRVQVTTGVLRLAETRKPFQVAVVASTDNLFARSLTNRNISRNVAPLLHATDGEVGLSGSHKNIALGRLIDLHSVSPIKFGEPLNDDGQVITTQAIDALPTSFYETEHLNVLEEREAGTRSGLSVIPGTAGIADLPEEMGYSNAVEVRQQLRDSRDILLSASPSWRYNEDRLQEVKNALSLFQREFKPISEAANTGRLVDDFLSKLTQRADAEILVVAAKSARRTYRYDTHVVTREDLLKAGMDRELAIEQGIIAIKKNCWSTRKGFHFAAFDIAKTLRPEAIRYLNELQENARLDQARQATGQEKDAPKRRGKRQDKGMVAGLAAKDLRGKASSVLAVLDGATPEDQKRFVTKTRLWEAPDWAFLRSPSDEDINDGARAMEPIVAAFFDEMRSRISPAPPANIPELTKAYARFVLSARDTFDTIRTQTELEDALKPDGVLGMLHTKTEEHCRLLGIKSALLLGDSLFDRYRMYGKKEEYAFGGAYYKAERRTLENSRWDIKIAEPGKGRRPSAEDKPLSGAMPMLSRLVRKGGKDHRGGLDVSEETVLKTFGFSGIEYGNSMTQADRTTYLNEAYDGFLDLADLLEVPPKALSLGGTLGLAFGSRGKGGRRAALAHFEPSNNAINLTRMKGAGSMAHEYGHAFANYLYRLSKGVPGSRSAGDITKLLDGQVKRGNDILGGNLREPVTDAVANLLRAMRYRKANSDLKQETLFVAGARLGDMADGRTKKPYWATIEEMFARAFETYVASGMADKYPGFRNDFLVRRDKLSVWGDIPHSAKTALEKVEHQIAAGEAVREKRPTDATNEELKAYQAREGARTKLLSRIRKAPILYPGGDELKQIKQSFKHLFETLETKDQKVRHEHLGEIELPILYSRDAGLIARVSEREHQILAECVLEEVARMCGPDVWVSWHKELADAEGKAVAGRYREHTNVHGTVRSVIDLAYGSPMGTAHHEAFHFAQAHLIQGEDLTMLDRYFSADAELTARLVDSLVQEGRHEAASASANNPREAQAYAYEQWVRGKLDVSVTQPPVSVFGRVRAFFSRIFGLATHSGFQTPQQIFQAFHSGHLAEKAQDQRVKEAMTSSTHPSTTPQAFNDRDVSETLTAASKIQAEKSGSDAGIAPESSSGRVHGGMDVGATQQSDALDHQAKINANNSAYDPSSITSGEHEDDEPFFRPGC